LFVLGEHGVDVSSPADFACRFLDGVSEGGLMEYDLGRLSMDTGHVDFADMGIGPMGRRHRTNSGLESAQVGADHHYLAVLAAKINSTADRCYRNKEYADAEVIYSLQIKLLLACLIMDFRFSDTGTSPYSVQHDKQGTELLSYLSSAYFNRANTYDELNTAESWRKALADHERALRYGNPQPWDVLFNMGLIYEKMRDTVAARTQFLGSLEGAPRSCEARVQRALARLT
jgi:hypothetical protein